MSKVSHVSSVPARAPAKLDATHNDLPLEVRQKVVALLQVRLTQAVDFTMQCKQAHWTVKGPHFAALHQLFDDAHDEGRAAMDVLAERAVTLGGRVDGTVQAAAAQSTLPPYPVATRDGMDHVEALSRGLAAFLASLRRGIDEVDDLGDAVSADNLTQLAGTLDKRLWMIEAHRQA